MVTGPSRTQEHYSIPMKPRLSLVTTFQFCALFLACALPDTGAADQTWKGSADNQWNNTANWSGSALPGTADNVVYNGQSSANLSNWLSGAFSIKGILFTNPSGPVSINGDSALTLGTAGINLSNATQMLTINAPLTLNGNQTWGATTNQTLSVLGPVSGSGTLTKSYWGTLVLSGNNNFTGNFTDDGGAVWINNSTALGTGTKTITVANNNVGAGLHLNGTNGNITLASGLSLTLSQQNGAIFNEAGDNVINGNINVTSGGGYVYIVSDAGTLTLNGTVSLSTTPRAFALGGVANGTLNGRINNNTGLPFRKLDAGTWTLTNNNTYNGYTTVEGGTLVFAPTAQMPNTTNITVFANAVLDVSAVTNSAGSNALFLSANQVLAGSGSVLGSVATVSSAGLQPGSLNNAQTAGGMGVAGTLSISSNLVMGATVTDYFELNTDTTIGSGVNDLISVGGDLDPQGARLFVTLLSSPTVGGTYRLFNYGGAELSAFNPTVATDTHYSFALDESVPNQINVTVSGGLNLLWSGSPSSTLWDLNGTANWNGNSVKFLNFDPVAFDDTGATNRVTLSGTLKPASVTFSNSATSYLVQGSGKLSGPTGLTKWNDGTLIISNTASDYTGPVTVNGGVLAVSSVAANGAASSLGAGTSVILDGGTLQFGGAKPAASSFNRAFTLGPNGGTVSPTNQTFFIMNTISGPGSFTKAGPAQLILGDIVNGVLTNALNTYAGNTYVTQGDLQIRNAHGVGFGKVFVSSGADLAVGGGGNYGTVTNDVELNGGDGAKAVGALMVNDAGTVVSFGGTITLNADSSVGSVTPTSFTISGPIVGPGQLKKLATATVTLSNPGNTYSGGTLVSAGTLDVKTDGGLGAGDVTVASGATLKLEAGSANTYIDASANLLLQAGTPVVNLAFSGTPNSIKGLSFDGGATFKAAGTWGSPSSGAAHTDSRFTGTGVLNVLTGPATSVSVSSSDNPVVYGNAVTLTATLTPANATGTVTFSDGANVLGTSPVSGGQATLSIGNLTVVDSPHAMTAVYNGDDNNDPSTSDIYSQVVTPATSTTALSSSQNPSTESSNVTFTATVSAAVGTPAGEVVFLANGVPFSTNGLVSGVAAAGTSTLAVGTNTIAAQFAAQGNYQASTDSLEQVVQSAVVYSQTNYIVGLSDNLDGTLTLTLQGTPQAQYYLLATPDPSLAMTNWAALAGSTNTVTNLSGIWSFTVTNSSAQQFYRSAAVAPQP